MKELETLIQRMLDGELSKSEHAKLSALLKDNTEAQTYYAQQCQVHAELLFNEELRATLPTEPPIDEEPASEPETDSENKRPPLMPFVWMVAASVAISVTIVIAYQSFTEPESTRAGSDVVASADTVTPQEVYEQTEFSGVGSQQRPPTPFANIAAQHGDDTISFNQDIRPILSENCYACHGPDANTREADLRLDLEEWAFRERANDLPPAIVPGDRENSPVYQRIVNPLKSEIMPPPDSHKVLSEEQKELVGRWIDQGAKWEGHWAFKKPQKPDVPNIPWGKNEIDKFTYSAMKARGLEPNQEADRPTLARRLALDLTGLPPTPELVEAFIKDQSDQAYENLVEKLLANTAYGEHQARYWLDAARYADTHGLHLDNYREIWPYRDWVIQAFNENKPFDEFTVEQIAGDLLPEATLEQRLATGFNRCNPTTSEGGAIDAEYRAIYAKDRVETTATVFMGLTMGCASCHDHKFDPFTQKDFYQMSAFFNNFNGPIMDGNAYDTRPVVVIPKPDHETEWTKVKEQRSEISEALNRLKEDNKAAYLAWQEQEDVPFVKIENDLPLALELKFEPQENKDNKADDEEKQEIPNHPFQKVSMDNSINLAEAGYSFDATQPFTMVARVKLPAEGPEKLDRVPIAEQFDGDRGWRLSVANSDPTFPNRYQVTFELIHSLRSNNLISVTAKSERVNPREFSTSNITINYDGSGSVAGLTVTANSRQPYDYSKVIDNLSGPVLTDAPLIAGQYKTGLITEDQASKNYKTGFYDKSGDEPKTGYPISLKIYSRPVYGYEFSNMTANRLKDILKVPAERRRPRNESELEAYYYTLKVPEYLALKQAEAENNIRYNHIYDQATVSLVMEEKDAAATAFMLERGEYDKPTEEVHANVPDALGGLPADAPKNRLGLANWLIDENNPLTARVTVNRIWQNLFGIGIVETAEDFGIMGQNPSHPELLDWLAVHFQESGWDVKGLIRLIVNSATYKQSSAIKPEEYAIDSENRYLARGSRYRLDGEVLRDQALFVSDSMNPRIGGRPVKPYQPEGIWNAVAYSDSNTAHFSQDYGDALYRRSLYTFWKRTAPPPNMVVFDVPSRETCNVRRERTNTPLQALTLMNDPQFVEAARQLAERVMREGSGSEKDRISQMYKFAFGVPPKDKHHDILHNSYQTFFRSFDESPKDAEQLIQVGDSYPTPDLNPVELASLTMVANQIMNLDSFINKN